MGGEIWCEGAEGDGARFGFTLPRHEAPPVGETRKRAAAKASEKGPGRRTLRA
jgi:hypothetical protein